MSYTGTADATKAHLRLETFGSAAQPSFGQLNSIAVDPATGNLLVIDSQAGTVSRFNPDGTPADFSALGTNVIDAKGPVDGTPQDGFSFGSTPGQQQVAVDDSGTLTDGNIYVTQGLQATGNLIDVFASSGEYLGQITGAGGAEFGTAPETFPYSPCGVAVDAEGSLFVAAGYEKKVYKFDPSANPPLSTDLVATYTDSGPVCNLAVGGGSVFVDSFIFNDEDRVTKLSSANLAPQGVMIPGDWRVIAVDPADGHLYAVDSGGVASEFDAAGSPISNFFVLVTGGVAIGDGKIFAGGGLGSAQIGVFGPLVTVPEVTTGGATITGDTSVSLEGMVNPDGVVLEECFFEYGPTDEYGQLAPCKESVAEIGTAPKEVHAELSGLNPESLYHYRLVAKNANATIKGEDETVKTPGKPTIVGQWSFEVGYAEATLGARINPENSPTTYRFEWGTDSTYGNATAELALGADNTEHLVSFGLDALQPGVTYHYRVVAVNGIDTTAGADHAFTTFPLRAAAKTDCPNQAFRAGPGAELPDCRAYEMVSPVDKNGADIKVLVSNLNFPARLDQSSAQGDRFTYSSSAAFADPASAPWSSQYLASRTGTGWSSEAISTKRNLPSLNDANHALKFDTQYKAFSADLSEGWLFHDTNPPLDACAPPDFSGLYRRDSASGAYEALTPVKPLSVPPEGYGLEPQGSSADGSHSVFRANAQLTAKALPASGFTDYQVYEHVRGEGCGELRLVSVLPNGKPSLGSVGTAPGQPGEGRENSVARAVSADGSKIYWSRSYPGPLYVRVDGSKTVEVSAERAQFWTASTDGSKAFYTIEDSASPLDRNLYEFDLASKASTLVAEGTSGKTGASSAVVGASEDGSRLYFVSDKALAGAAEAEKPNLYLREAGTTRLVATISEEDLPIGVHASLGIAGSPTTRGTRLTPDGGTLVFTSTASLTGYDSKDAANGRPAAQLYRYDAIAEELDCVSCNPSGARPATREIKGLTQSRMVAAMMPAWQTHLHAPRALSDDGRQLFFEAFDALLPRDVNGKADVYQWQAAGSQAQCEQVGAELYVESSGGCLSLISTGLDPSDTELADATPDGSNVFIRTAQSLVSQDPGQVDVYDARVNGGFPPPPALPAACEGEACQGPLSPPDDPTPASSAFNGAGNVQERKPPRPRCAKGKTRRKGRCMVRNKRAGKAKAKAKRHRER